jgi:hypothetical protein
VKDYPTHAFVIDQQEAGNLFRNVDGFSQSEQAFFELLPSVLESPPENPLITNFASYVAFEASNIQQEKKNVRSRADTRKTPTSSSGKRRQKSPGGKPNGRFLAASDEGESGEDGRRHVA